jgi:transcriptional regulator with XRE-family HTH domain
MDQLGLSAAVLAAQTGLTQRNIERLLAGQQKAYASTLKRLADALRVSDPLSLLRHHVDQGPPATPPTRPPRPQQERDSPLAAISRRIDALPPLVQLVVAVRCARRVEPVFSEAADRLHPSERQPVHAALEMAAAIIKGVRPSPQDAAECHERSKSVSRWCGERYGEEDSSRRVSACITVTMRAAKKLMNGEAIGKDVWDAVDGSARGSKDHPDVVTVTIDDFEHLASQVGIAPSVLLSLRPLWPNGPPTDWPQCVLWR